MNLNSVRRELLQIHLEKLSQRTTPPEHRFSTIVKNPPIKTLMKFTGMGYHVTVVLLRISML